MAQAEMKAAIAALGITAKFEFVPWSKSRSAKGPHKSRPVAVAPSEVGKSITYVDRVYVTEKNLNWRVRLITQRGGVGPWFDYMQGIAYAPAYKIPGVFNADKEAALEREVEHGKTALGRFMTKPLPPSDLGDVLYCLVSDADVLEHANFEAWAQEYGYDVDSRSAEGIYRECLNLAIELRARIGEDGLKLLREACNDF